MRPKPTIPRGRRRDVDVVVADGDLADAAQLRRRGDHVRGQRIGQLADDTLRVLQLLLQARFVHHVVGVLVVDDAVFLQDRDRRRIDVAGDEHTRLHAANRSARRRRSHAS
jgi:hypothetical protein